MRELLHSTQKTAAGVILIISQAQKQLLRVGACKDASGGGRSLHHSERIEVALTSYPAFRFRLAKISIHGVLLRLVCLRSVCRRIESIPYMKPHGSINWFALLDREMLSVDVGTTNWDVFCNDLTYYLLFLKDPLGSRDLGKSSYFVKAALARVPSIVPPIASKILSVGGMPRDGFVASGHQRAMQLIWKSFQEYVSDATQLVIIGYSLPGTDASSVSVLRTFAPNSTSRRRKRVLIVDKNPACVERYKRLVHPDSKLVWDDFKSFDPASV